MAWDIRRKPFGKAQKTNFRMLINTTREMDERVLEDVIIHEMIHLYIAYFDIRDTSSHGKVFCKMMEDINRKHGRNISVSYHGDRQSDAAQAQTQRSRWHVIAVCRMREGWTGIKVLPRIAQRIAFYHRNVTASEMVETVEYYLHNDPWFDRYPNSTALKVYKVDKNELMSHLQGAKKLDVRDYL